MTPLNTGGTMAFSDGVHYGPTTQELSDAFTDMIESLGGFVSDCHDDGSCLFLRAVLPIAADVGPGDTIRGGIAVRAAGPAISVHPYTMRQICTNGAILAQATQSVHLERVQHDGIVVPSYDVSMIAAQFSEAVRACAAPEAFIQSVDDMRAAMNREINLSLHVLPIADRLQPQFARAVMSAVFKEWTHAGDSSAFGMMNAITAVARQTADHETRWQLEEIGGSLPARVRGSQPHIVHSMAG